MKRLLLSFKVLLATMLLFAGGSAWATEVTLTYSEQGYTNAQSLDGVAVTVGDVTFLLDNASATNAPAYYDTGNAARVYPGATITVSSAAGNITAITLNAVQGKSGKETTLTADAGTLTDLAWTGDAASVVFTAAGAGHLRISSITVTTSDAAAAVKTPEASLATGTYFGTQSVELSCETEGATIYYTTDGTEPTAESTAYTAAIEISETTTLKAIAISGEDKSSVLTRTYTIGSSYANIAALVAGAQSGDQAQLTLTDAVVTYVNGADVYVQDATGALDFYAITKIGETELAAGSKLSGTAVVTYKVYNSLPEITALEGDVTVTAGEAPAATAMTVANAVKAENLNKYITISSATVTEDGIVSDTITLAIYDRWKTGTTVYPGLYDQITGVVSTYKGTAQLNFISADTTTLSSVAEGTYYMKNVATGKYFCGGNSWGTHASLNASGIDVILARLADGTYTIDTKLSNGGTSHYLSDVWCDGAPTGHGFYAVEGAENTYYIATVGGYLAYDGSTTSLIASAEQNENAQWVLVTKEQRIAELAQATKENPVDATFLIEDPNFGRNDQRVSAWTMEASNQAIGKNSNERGNAENYCAESYHSTFTLSQQIGLPAGTYGMTAQGFYRQDGSDTENLPVFYLGEKSVTFPVKTGSENSMSDASVSFSNGLYTSDAVYAEVSTDSVLVGAKLENNTNLWCIWDNFQLTYYGTEVTADELENAALYEQLASLIEEAKELQADETLPEAKKEGLAEAIAAGEAVTAETLKDAIASLNAAIAAPKVYKGYGEVLAQMKALTESTNVYTEDALYEYYGQWQAKYDEGTLTDEEGEALVNPYNLNGWHNAALTLNKFLLDSWDTGNDFDRYYINTWSQEGITDGSNFKVPFFEYWTGDAATLAADNLSATVKNLAPGEYTVSAVVRVRLSDSAAGAAPAGIVMQANDGEAVSVCEGTAYGALYVDTVSVTGVVAEDSTLTIKFIVSDSTNVSWLSFQNVNYEAPAAELEIPVSVERTTGQGYSTTDVDIDYTEALAFLGISSVSEATVVGINVTDGSLVDNSLASGPTYDGWRNASGDFEQWGNNAAVCVKFLSDAAQFSICDMSNANVPAGGESFTCKWGLQANGKTAIYVVTVNFVDPAPASYTKLSELEVLETVTVNHEMVTGQGAYTQTTNSFDAAAIATTLGLESLSDAEAYWLSVTDSSLVESVLPSTIDGWRDANGDPLGYGYDGGICVKISDPASGVIDNICDYGTGTAGTVIHAPYVFANDNGQAVILDVVVTYVAPVGIQSLTNGQSLKNSTIYTLGGQRVSNVSKGGIYIVNGKKVLVK